MQRSLPILQMTDCQRQRSPREEERAPVFGLRLSRNATGKHLKGRKIHALVDSEGLPIRVVVHSAAIQDRAGPASETLPDSGPSLDANDAAKSRRNLPFWPAQSGARLPSPNGETPPCGSSKAERNREGRTHEKRVAPCRGCAHDAST